MANASNTLVVFDFDWSLVNENSDTWVIERLCPSLMVYLKAIRPEYKGQWTKLMDHMVHKMMEEEGITLDQINDALREIPVFKEMIEAIKLANQRGVTLAILSDANQHYIDVILKHLEIEHFSFVVTNNAIIEPIDERTTLRIYPFQPLDNPHNCTRCPSNLCKGLVLKRWMEQETWKRIVYIGDGQGDFCPTLLLREDDIILCRESWALHNSLQNVNVPPKAQIIPWSSGNSIFQLFQSLFPQ